MQTAARVLPATKPVFPLASFTFLAGVGGMAISFLFLASSHRLDVLAGAAGFIAGSILVSGGLISIALYRARLLDGQPSASALMRLPASPWNVGHWLAHFQRNREN